MKKILSLVLVIAMLATTLVACGSSEESKAPEESKEASEAASVAETSAEESKEESEDPYAHLRSFNYDGEEIVFLVENDSNTGRYKSVEILEHETNPDSLNEAIKARNDIIEEVLGCTITEVRTDSMLSDCRNDVSGSGEYDIFMPYMPDAASLAAEGALYDLNGSQFEGILKLENSYWDQRANSDLSFGGKLYFTTGDFSLLTFDCTHAIVFNKTLAEECGAEDPYELLENGQWTFDALWRNAKLATSDTDGTDGMSYQDTWGLFLNQGYTTTMYIGAGERLTNKDSDDIPYMAGVTDRSASVVAKIREIYNDSTSTIIIENYGIKGNSDSDVYAAASRATGENRALFRTLAIVDLQELDTYECSYGILPTPKYNEEQEEYYNIVSAILASCICISNSVRDPEMSAAVAECMAIASTDTVRLAYYDTILKGRRIPDDRGEFALDIIFNNRVYEMATIYSFGSLSSVITTCTSSKSDIFASTMESISGKVESAIEDLKELFESID